MNNLNAIPVFCGEYFLECSAWICVYHLVFMGFSSIALSFRLYYALPKDDKPQRVELPVQTVTMTCSMYDAEYAIVRVSGAHLEKEEIFYVDILNRYKYFDTFAQYIKRKVWSKAAPVHAKWFFNGHSYHPLTHGNVRMTDWLPASSSSEKLTIACTSVDGDYISVIADKCGSLPLYFFIPIIDLKTVVDLVNKVSAETGYSVEALHGSKWDFNGVGLNFVELDKPIHEVLYLPALFFTKTEVYEYIHGNRGASILKLVVRSDGNRRLVIFDNSQAHGTWTRNRYDKDQQIKLTFQCKGKMRGRISIIFNLVNDSEDEWTSADKQIQLKLKQ
jgi:hypothetical protein